ncbi:hypothetical protein MTO96_017088 [Rhipicephalus appendiculatus]
MATPFCKFLLLALVVVQASQSTGAPATGTLAAVAEQGDLAKRVTPAGGGRRRKGRQGRYDYVYDCAKCDDNSPDIGSTVYAYD